MFQKKKIIYALFLLFIIITLVGCQKEHIHSFNEWEIKEHATKELPGILFRKCTACEFIEEQDMTYEYMENLVFEAMDNVKIEDEVKDSINLPTSYNGVSIVWHSKNTYYLTHDGIVNKQGLENKEIPLEAIFTYYDFEYTKDYKITILALTEDERIELAKKNVIIPESTDKDIKLVFNPGYDVKVSYESNNPEYITNTGRVNLQDEEKVVSIKVIYETENKKIEETKEIKLDKKTLSINKHQIIHRADQFDLNNISGLILKDGRIQLSDGVLKATYTSQEIETIPFYILVASFAAFTSKNATIEIKISVKVGNQWSDFVTYQPWGLGLENETIDHSNSLVEMATDEVKVLNGQEATAFKYEIIFKRDALNVESPKLSLFSAALKIYAKQNYSYKVTTGMLPEKVEYDVPMLNQNVVPSIGNIICSATSTTMLLKYYGFNFSDKDSEYEHRYIASLVLDHRGSRGIYGNWPFNTAVMGAYGLDAYVARMYSTEELMYHLANVGPVAITVGGQMTSDVGNYYTDGHLLVCKGYEILEDGSVNFLCNDPNVKVVSCKYTETKIKSTWSGIVYVIEKK